MVKALGVAAAFLMLGTSYISPAYALSLDGAIEQCRIVAAEEERVNRDEENQYRGFCITATGQYLKTLAESGLAPDALGAELATYVVLLTELLNERFCRSDSEIPQAIAMTGDASRDPDQEEQIRLIAMTVINCTFATTASIGSIVPNLDGSGSPASAY